MGRIIRGQRKGAGSIFTSNTSKRKGEAKHRQAVRSRPSSHRHRAGSRSGPARGFSPPDDASARPARPLSRRPARRVTRVAGVESIPSLASVQNISTRPRRGLHRPACACFFRLARSRRDPVAECRTDPDPPPAPRQDYAERHGYIKGVVTDIIHDPGRGAPLAKVRVAAEPLRPRHAFGPAVVTLKNSLFAAINTLRSDDSLRAPTLRRPDAPTLTFSPRKHDALT